MTDTPTLDTPTKPIVLKRTAALTTNTPPDIHALGASTRLSLKAAYVCREMAAVHLILAGQEMAVAKKQLGETRGPKAAGEERMTWSEWLATYTEHGETWASRLIAASRKYRSEETDAEILSLLDVAPSQLNDEQRDKLTAATKRFTGDRGISQIIAEIGCSGRKENKGTGKQSAPAQETRPACYTDAMWELYQGFEDGSQQKLACLALAPIISDVLPIASEDADVSSAHLPFLPPLFITELHSALAAATKRLAAMLPKRKPAKKKPAKKKGARNGR